MKTRTITVNKSEKEPNGVAIELVEVESKLEERIMRFFLTNLLRFMQDRNTLAVKLPESFYLEYKDGGSFIVLESPKSDEAQGGLYQQAKPVAVLGIRLEGKGFDLVYREVPASERQAVPRSEIASHEVNIAENVGDASELSEAGEDKE